MAKSKKTAATSAAYGKKKEMLSSARKPAKKNTDVLDSKKIETISKKINNMNKNFETLIKECQSALNGLLVVNA